MYWDTSPILIDFGFASIKWYGLLFALGFVFGYLIIKRVYEAELKPIEDVDRLFLVMFVSTLIGARLGHCLFYDPVYYLGHPLEIIKVWRGGLASHGGAIGIFIGLYVYSRSRESQPYLWLLDRIAIPTALAGSLIRLGNLFNSEIVGEPTSVAWAVTFARVDNLPRHPAQLYESFAYLAIFLILFLVYRRSRATTPQGRLVGLFLVLVFTARFVIEFVKVPQAAFGGDLILSVGQLLSIPAIIVGIVLLILSMSAPSEKEVQEE